MLSCPKTNLKGLTKLEAVTWSKTQPSRLRTKPKTTENLETTLSSKLLPGRNPKKKVLTNTLAAFSNFLKFRTLSTNWNMGKPGVVCPSTFLMVFLCRSSKHGFMMSRRVKASKTLSSKPADLKRFFFRDI